MKNVDSLLINVQWGTWNLIDFFFVIVLVSSQIHLDCKCATVKCGAECKCDKCCCKTGNKETCCCCSKQTSN